MKSETSSKKDYEKIIDKWFREYIHNSRVSENTKLYNEISSYVEILKQKIKD